MDQNSIYEIDLYIQHAHQMLDVAMHNLHDGFYGSADLPRA
jgi:hypothetical protein